eukprot:m.231740 g.231740  ORF g.231740 m.231740 type:complete len:66 (-) comp16010_c1_seq1:17-214(-)
MTFCVAFVVVAEENCTQKPKSDSRVTVIDGGDAGRSVNAMNNNEGNKETNMFADREGRKPLQCCS